MKNFKELDKRQVHEVESSILENWKKQNILDKTIENRKNASDWVFHDGPACVGAESVFSRVIGLFDGTDERHISVTDQVKQIVRTSGVTFRDGNDESEIGGNELIFDVIGIGKIILDLLHQFSGRTVWIQCFPQIGRPHFQVIHFSEEVLLLSEGQKRDRIEACEI